MKKHLVILLLLLLNTPCLKSEDNLIDKIFDGDKILRPVFERDLNSGWNNYAIIAGLGYYQEYEISRIFTNKVDMIQIGVSIKTKDYIKYKPSFNFLLLDYLTTSDNKNGEFDKSYKHFVNHYPLKLYGEVKALKYTTNLLYDRNIDWFNLGMGYGYAFFNELEKRLIPIVYLRFGYDSYKLDKNIFNELSRYSSLNFSNFEIKTGAKLIILYYAVGLDIVADYTKVMDGPNLDILSLSSKLKLTNQKDIKDRRYRMDQHYLHKNLDFFLGCDYKKFSIPNHSQKVLSFSVGLDWFFIFKEKW